MIAEVKLSLRDTLLRRGIPLPAKNEQTLSSLREWIDAIAFTERNSKILSVNDAIKYQFAGMLFPDGIEEFTAYTLAFDEGVFREELKFKLPEIPVYRDGKANYCLLLSRKLDTVAYDFTIEPPVMLDSNKSLKPEEWSMVHDGNVSTV